MSLLVYNLTAVPLVLANGLSTTIPASTAGAGVKGEPWYASGNELEGRSVPEYTTLQAQQAAGLVTFEWQFAPEYDTYPLFVASAQEDITSVDQEIYVDGATGNDANPGTSALPVQTWDAGFNKMQAGRKKRRIYVKAGTYNLSTGGQPTKDYIFPVPVGALGTDAEPVAVIGDNVTVETGTIATVVSGQRIFTRNTLAAPQVGAAITFTSGAAAGRRGLIAFDDGTTITLLDSAGAALAGGAPGDAFTIERPATIFNLIDNPITFTGAPFGLKNVKFTGTVTPNLRTFRIADQANCQSIENVEFDTNALIMVVGNLSICRTASDDNGFLAPNPFSRALRRTCGMFINGSLGGFVADRKSVLGQGQSGGVVLQNAGLFLQSEAQFLANGPPPCGTNAIISSELGSLIVTDGPNSVRGIFKGSYDGIPGGIPGCPVINVGAINATGPGYNAARGYIRRLTINDAVNDGIRVSAQSDVYVDQVLGANNAGYGMKIQNVGSALSQTSTPGAPLGNTNCTITGRNGVVLSSALTLALAAVGATVDVASTAGFPVTGVIKIDNELISYTGINPLQFTGCVRGTNNTIAASHLLGALASQASGADTIIGATPKQYGAINGTPAFAELFAGMPTGNAFGIRQS